MRASSTSGSILCVVGGNPRMNRTPMSRLICPIQTVPPRKRIGVSQKRAWFRRLIVPRAFCPAMSCLRPKTYSGLTGEYR